MSFLDTPASAIAAARDFIKNALGIKPATVFPKPDFPSGFTIQEIEEGVEREKIVLIGNQMPLQPFSYGGEQRMVKTFYPGQSEPSHHVLGAEEKNVTINGRLYDKRYNDPSLRGVAYEVAKQIDAMRIRGNLVRINLGNAWQRYGFIESCDFDMKTLADMKYKIEFSIIGFNPPLRAYILDRSKEVPFSINKDLINRAATFQSTYSNIPTSVPRSLADQIRAITGDIASVVASVTGFIDDTLATVEDIGSALTRAVGLVQYSYDKVGEYREQLGRIAMTGSSLGVDIPTRYTNASFIFGMISETHDITSILAELRDRFAQLSATTPDFRYLVKENDTLQKIAAEFYADSSQWEKIYDHNKLTSTLLVEGSVLEIPKK